VLEKTDPAGARTAIEHALQRNPTGPEIDEIAAKLGVKR
jgi:hypothetical protein